MDNDRTGSATGRTAQTLTTPDGRVLVFAEWGDPHGRPVFSMHGTPGCRLLGARRVELGFEELLRSLGVRLITYDRPGYGGSTRHPGRRVVDCVADALAVADASGVARFAIEGSSSGAHHALAVAAVAGQRITRVACVAPMAPYNQLGHDEWSRGQAPGVREYVAACLQGVDRMLAEFGSENDQLRASASADDPRSAEVFEQTRNGLWGWVDDEVSAFQPWGFDPAAVSAPAAIWHDPNDPVLPIQHAEWLANTVRGATLMRTHALGHGSSGDPKTDWSQLYSWLAAPDA
jgi:pimeloyl-ACP methyl ester carboxylesterase